MTLQLQFISADVIGVVKLPDGTSRITLEGFVDSIQVESSDVEPGDRMGWYSDDVWELFVFKGESDEVLWPTMRVK